MFYFVGDVNSAKDALEPGHHIIGVEVDMATAGNDEAAGCLCLDLITEVLCPFLAGHQALDEHW